MVSKKQAAALGDALIQGNLSRRQPPPYPLRLFPELERIPPDDREIALRRYCRLYALRPAQSVKVMHE